ncbi:MAG: hypothetical protein QM774_05335 [Gordonia sp. (in: high G+C Gram-positive bacteria)]|uniref:hypothetical protein n=1 Tax=Gordonia sp. (in: high G+C Gram-positive bacteria) TaxID=84139 RepID=UPI0039E3EC10
MRKSPKLLILTPALASAVALGLTACSDGSDDAAASSAKPVEERKATPRLALTHDGGVDVLDGTSLSDVDDVPVEGFTRVNDAGDGRHVFVSTSNGFELLDLGAWSEAHGDHSHHYSSEPRLTGTTYDADKPGHVVLHDGRTTLFDDGTGKVRILDSAKIGEDGSLIDEFSVPAHHGVAVARADGSVVVSKGDEDTRTGLVIRDAQGATVAQSDECPGLHGEAGAADGVLTFGCEDGVLIVRGTEISKVKADAPYARIGNQRGGDGSPITLGDYKTDKGNEHEHPQQFSLIDTTAKTIRVVPTGGWSYSFRSLGRGKNGEALILGTDGALHVFDPASGQEIRTVPLIGAWSEPDDWQEPMPSLYVQGDTAYIDEPSSKRLIAVSLDDYRTLTETKTAAPGNELAGVTG